MRPLYRNIIGIALISIVTIGLGAIIWLQSQKDQGATNANSNTSIQNTNVNTATDTNVNTNSVVNTNSAVNTNSSSSVISDETNQQSLVRLAKLIVDRYGTYSNRNNFENITGLEAYMTDGFKKSSAEFITARQSEGVPPEYYSIVTSALAAEVNSYTKNKIAVVDVSTRRIETKSGSEQKIFTQHVFVTFRSVMGNWKVDAIDWK